MSKPKVTTTTRVIKNDMPQFKKAMRNANGAFVDVGWFKGMQNPNTGADIPTYSTAVNFGVPSKNIAPRMFVQKANEHVKPRMIDEIKKSILRMQRGVSAKKSMIQPGNVGVNALKRKITEVGAIDTGAMKASASLRTGS